MTTDSFHAVDFDYTRTELHGPMLIEASAGTGKTFSLERIILRLIVEEDENGTAVGLDHLLLVTFTNAATSELRMRVRQTLRNVLRTWNTLLQGKTPNEKVDSLIQGWFDAAEIVRRSNEPNRTKEAVNDWHRRVKKRLEDACHVIDVAAIYTIHAFAQKLLKEFSLSCDGFAERQILQDAELESIKADLLDNYLREHLPSDNPSLLKEILQYTEVGEAFKDLGREKPEYIRTLTVKKLTSEETKDNKKGAEKATALSPEAKVWFTKLFTTFPGLLSERLRRLGYATHDGMLLELLGYLREQSGHPDQNGGSFIDTVRTRYRAVLIDEFQDTDPVQYEIFKILFLDAKSCRTPPSDKIFFVGDPKQAIYSFRSAELETYLLAKKNIRVVKSLSINYRSTPSLIGVFNRFFSSEAAFQMSEASFPTRIEPCQNTPPLPLRFKEFENGHVEDLPSFEFWTIPSGKVEAEKIKARKLSPASIELNAISNDIVSLLGGQINGKKGTIFVYAGTEKERPIEAGDIAVLVRRNVDAQKVVTELRSHGLRAAVLSKESVFSRPEAVELLLFLQAVLTPKTRSAFNSAAATVFVGYSLADRLNETRASCLQEILRQVAADLPEYGAYAVLLRLMRETEATRGFGTIARLLKEENSRALINYQHLLDLIECEQRHTQSLSGLIAWLTQKIAQSSNVGDDEKLRPDNGKSLINVMTIHASKGLEFPVVYLAGAGSLKPKIDGSQKRFTFRETDSEGNRYLIAYPEKQPLKEHVDTVTRETQETQRLAYVAMTRASQRLVLPLVFTLTSTGKYRDCDSNAYLKALLPTKGSDTKSKGNGLEAMNSIFDFIKQNPGNYIAYQLGPCKKHVFRSQKTGSSKTSIVYPAQSLERVWTQSSFTTLSKFFVNNHDTGSACTYLSFPAGADAGTFLHKVMETAIVRAGGLPKEVLDSDTWLIEHVNRSFDWNMKGTLGTLSGSEQPDPAVGIAYAGDFEAYCRAWLIRTFKQLFQTPIFEGETLRDLIGKRHLAPEIGFLGSIGNRAFTPDRLEKAFTENSVFSFVVNRGEGSKERFPLAQSLYGFLAGQIDLIFKDKNERYWIVDWKSNKIEDPEQNHSRDYFGNYTTEAMDSVMRGANYKLQALCYLTALKRFLHKYYKNEALALSHMGGALYVFLRGIGQVNGRQTGIYRMPMDSTLTDAVNTLDRLLTSR